MKSFIQQWWTAALAIIALIGMSSCVSTRTRMLNQSDILNVHVIGSVNTKFQSWQWLHIPTSVAADKAYTKLMNEARKQYVGMNIDVVNIRTKGSWNVLQYFIYPSLILGNIQSINAIGDVILLDGDIPNRPTIETPVKTASPVVTYAPPTIDKPKGLENAVRKVCSSIMNELQNGSKIAVINISADNPNTSLLVLDEVEFNLVSTKRFTIVDRNTLDVIRKEQLIQTSGEFDDQTLVKFGRLSGASVVIAGSIMKSGNTNRLSLKAMNVQTGQIITMARESY